MTTTEIIETILDHFAEVRFIDFIEMQGVQLTMHEKAIIIAIKRDMRLAALNFSQEPAEHLAPGQGVD